MNITQNGTFLEQAGTDRRLCVNLDPGYDVSEIINEGENRSTETHTFIGRLYQKNAADDGAIQMCLDSTSPDLDQDLLSYEDELNYGTNSSNSDSDGDGITDGQEVSDGTNPSSEISETSTIDQQDGSQSSNSESNDKIKENNADNTELNNNSDTDNEGIDLNLIIKWVFAYTIISLIFITIMWKRNKKSNLGLNEAFRRKDLEIISERGEVIKSSIIEFYQNMFNIEVKEEDFEEAEMKD